MFAVGKLECSKVSTCQLSDIPTGTQMIKGFLNIPYFVWSALALILAIVWVYVGPHTKLTPTPDFRYFVIRWGHALTWVLLAVSFFLRGISPSLNGVANIIAAAGGLVYLLFMLMAFVVK
jgi:hypothetical protein